MLIFAGLGNPGSQYQNNRHNAGFMAADAIARRHSFSPWSKKFQGLLAEGTIDGEKILLLKPQTWMNLSGQSVGEAMRFYKLSPADLVVLYDEIDLAPAATTASARSTSTSARTTGACASASAIPASRSWCMATCFRISPRPTATGSSR